MKGVLQSCTVESMPDLFLNLKRIYFHQNDIFDNEELLYNVTMLNLNIMKRINVALIWTQLSRNYGINYPLFIVGTVTQQQQQQQ